MTITSSNHVLKEFLQLCSILPNSNLRTYETQLTNYASKNVSKNEFDILLNWLISSLGRKKGTADTRSLFAAFFVLCIYSRRMKNLSTYNELIRNYGDYFQDDLLYPHIVALYHKQYNTPEDMENAIHFARMAVENLPRQSGVLHSFVEAVVTAEEHGLELSKETLEDAKMKMEEVIKLDSQYAKFQCTKGRILAIFKNYSEAKNAIYKAIDKEDSSSTDYAIRLNEYQTHLNRIQTNESYALILSQLEKTRLELDQSKKQIEASMEKMQKDNLQSLAFFVAIISLTIGSLNMIGNKTFKESSFLIIILTGCILLGYLSLGILFQPKNIKKIHQLFILFIGLILIGGPLVIYYIL